MNMSLLCVWNVSQLTSTLVRSSVARKVREKATRLPLQTSSKLQLIHKVNNAEQTKHSRNTCERKSKCSDFGKEESVCLVPQL